MLIFGLALHKKQSKLIKKIIFSFLPVGLLCCSMRSDDCITKDGYLQGKRVFGKVKVVESFLDFKVKVVSSFPDLKVKIVNRFPDEPGVSLYSLSF